MIEINNENELIRILKLISEEAVKLSEEKHEDPYLKDYNKKVKKDESIYGSLSEQEDAAEEPPFEITDEEEAEAEEKPAEEADDAEKEPAPEAQNFGVSFDSVITAINTLRAGRSLKDSSIKDQTSAYYDRLSDPERQVLLLFLRELSKILAGTVDGSDAIDPSDTPFNITIDSQQATDTEETPTEGEAEAEEAGADEAEDETIEDEDTSPPIRVDEAQDTRSIRRKIKRLMLRG